MAIDKQRAAELLSQLVPPGTVPLEGAIHDVVLAIAATLADEHSASGNNGGSGQLVVMSTSIGSAEALHLGKLIADGGGDTLVEQINKLPGFSVLENIKTAARYIWKRTKEVMSTNASAAHACPGIQTDSPERSPEKKRQPEVMQTNREIRHMQQYLAAFAELQRRHAEQPCGNLETNLQFNTAREVLQTLHLALTTTPGFRNIRTGDVHQLIGCETPFIRLYDPARNPGRSEVCLREARTFEGSGQDAGRGIQLLDSPTRSRAWTAAILLGASVAWKRATIGDDEQFSFPTIIDGARRGIDVWSGSKLSASAKSHVYTDQQLQLEINAATGSSQPPLSAVLAEMDEEVSEVPPTSVSEAEMRVITYIEAIALAHGLRNIQLNDAAGRKTLAENLLRTPRSYERDDGSELSLQETSARYEQGLQQMLSILPQGDAFFEQCGMLSGKIGWGTLNAEGNFVAPPGMCKPWCALCTREELVTKLHDRHAVTTHDTQSHILVVRRDPISRTWAGIRFLSLLTWNVSDAIDMNDQLMSRSRIEGMGYKIARDCILPSIPQEKHDQLRRLTLDPITADEGTMIERMKNMSALFPQDETPESEYEAFVRVETFAYQCLSSGHTDSSMLDMDAALIVEHRERWQSIARRWWKEIREEAETAEVYLPFKRLVDGGMETLTQTLPPQSREETPHGTLHALRAMALAYPTIPWNAQPEVGRQVQVNELTFRKEGKRTKARTFITALTPAMSDSIPAAANMFTSIMQDDNIGTHLRLHMIPGPLRQEWAAIECVGEIMEGLNFTLSGIRPIYDRSIVAIGRNQRATWGECRAGRALVMAEASDRLRPDGVPPLLAGLRTFCTVAEIRSPQDIVTLLGRDAVLLSLLQVTAPHCGGLPLSARECGARLWFLIEMLAIAGTASDAPSRTESGAAILAAASAIAADIPALETHIGEAAERMFPLLQAATLAPSSAPDTRLLPPTGAVPTETSPAPPSTHCTEDAPTPPTSTPSEPDGLVPPITPEPGTSTPPGDVPTDSSPAADSPEPAAPLPESSPELEAMDLLLRRTDPRDLARHFLACASMDVERINNGPTKPQPLSAHIHRAKDMIPSPGGNKGRNTLPTQPLPSLVLHATEIIAQSTPKALDEQAVQALCSRLIGEVFRHRECLRLNRTAFETLLLSTLMALHHAGIPAAGTQPGASRIATATASHEGLVYTLLRDLSLEGNEQLKGHLAAMAQLCAGHVSEWEHYNPAVTIAAVTGNSATAEQEADLRLGAMHRCLALRLENALEERKRCEELLSAAERLRNTLPPSLERLPMRDIVRSTPDMQCRIEQPGHPAIGMDSRHHALTFHSDHISLPSVTFGDSDHPHGQFTHQAMPTLARMRDHFAVRTPKPFERIHAYAMESLAVTCPGLLEDREFLAGARIVIGPDKIRILAGKGKDWSWISPPVQLDPTELETACDKLNIDVAERQDLLCASVPLLEDLRTSHRTLDTGSALFPGGGGPVRAPRPGTSTSAPSHHPATPHPHETEHGEYRTLHACLDVLTQLQLTPTIHNCAAAPGKAAPHETTVGEGNFVAVDVVGEPYNVRLVFQSEQSNTAYVFDLADVAADGSDVRKTDSLGTYRTAHPNNVDLHWRSAQQFMNVLRHALEGRDLYLAPDASMQTPQAFVAKNRKTLEEAMRLICEAGNRNAKRVSHTPETMPLNHAGVDSGEAGIRCGSAFLEMCARQMGCDIDYGNGVPAGRSRQAQGATVMKRSPAQEFALRELQHWLYRAPPSATSTGVQIPATPPATVEGSE